MAGGAPRHKAAELMGLSERTVKRWRQADGLITSDRRPLARQVEQSHQLTIAEC
jgi:putative transposase